MCNRIEMLNHINWINCDMILEDDWRPYMHRKPNWVRFWTEMFRNWVDSNYMKSKGDQRAYIYLKKHRNWSWGSRTIENSGLLWKFKSIQMPPRKMRLKNMRQRNWTRTNNLRKNIVTKLIFMMTSVMLPNNLMMKGQVSIQSLSSYHILESSIIKGPARLYLNWNFGKRKMHFVRTWKRCFTKYK